jgi:hypothetical protein
MKIKKVESYSFSTFNFTLETEEEKKILRELRDLIDSGKILRAEIINRDYGSGHPNQTELFMYF